MREKYLVDTISNIPEMMELLTILNEIKLPNHYLAGGSVTQAVWNRKLGNDPLYKVKDFDVVYFDQKMSRSEKEYEAEIDFRKTYLMPVDVKNQANVHEWYGAKFGNNIEPLKESEDGIRMWLPCFAVGIRLVDDVLDVFAPFGLEDQANMIIRPNKTAMSKENYDTMNRSFKQRWPNLEIKEW
ncbi:hypothetical protein MSP8886_02454 [Marinomonas spartinae]|uniref:Nucleotidyltransferase family protein n=1 Tax=Marinomonas spartinae TaxID=1792290 RepID=A0A1A8TH17_9GAMM|nr:nucleotidyltransferase family protein [Marinomonas spartinae]SBS32526.1 hypothetical protein MSP8886_02454 [Marinomonas spartinae]